MLYQAALAADYHNPVLKPVARRLKEHGKPHKLVVVAIARRLVTIANAGHTLAGSTPRSDTVANQVIQFFQTITPLETGHFRQPIEHLAAGHSLGRALMLPVTRFAVAKK